MKNPKHLLTILAFSLLLGSHCKKDPKPSATSSATTQNAPTAPTYSYNPEVETSKDVSMATYMVSDIDMAMGMASDGNIAPQFYTQPAGSTATTSVTFDLINKVNIIAYNNTPCADGKVRNGTVFGEWGISTGSNPLYHDYGFACSVNFLNYSVDGWRIALEDSSQPLIIRNQLSSSSYTPSNTTLSWSIYGNLRFICIAKPDSVITWEGALVKTLTNASDTNVLIPVSGGYRINWSLAKVVYTGSVTGTCNNESYSYAIDNTLYILRDFSCAYFPPGSTNVTQFHPFINGLAHFNISNFDPRTIDYGPAQTCDNSGLVSFSTQTHTVDFY